MAYDGGINEVSGGRMGELPEFVHQIEFVFDFVLTMSWSWLAH
jgi:hypothetical protein